jgi:putative ABC transport system permease protein
MFSFINIFGLAIGFTSCLLIAFYIYHETSYDKYQEFGNRLYQLVTISTVEGEEKRGATTPAPMAPAMQREFPEIRILHPDNEIISGRQNPVSIQEGE